MQGQSGVNVNVCYKRIEPVTIAMKRLSAMDLTHPRKELGMYLGCGAPTTSIWSPSRPKQLALMHQHHRQGCRDRKASDLFVGNGLFGNSLC